MSKVSAPKQRRSKSGWPQVSKALVKAGAESDLRGKEINHTFCQRIVDVVEVGDKLVDIRVEHFSDRLAECGK